MFLPRHSARTTLRRVLPSQVRHATGRVKKPEMYEPHGQVAEQLQATGLWRWGRRGPKAVDEPPAEKNRLNITNQGLCDNIASYIGPSLSRHHGCDLIDINPGAGLWSNTLHNLLQPRKHILMEPDMAIYKPFLDPLLSKPNVQLIPKPGIVWREVAEVLDTCLPDQTKRPPSALPERNDTLLVNVNLSFFPPKKFQLFECVSTMVLYQLMSSIRTAALFQQYGLVRMLIWINDDGKRRLLPRVTHRRNRAAFEAELACEWIHEVAGKDVQVEDRNDLRDEWLNMESGYQTLERMDAAGITMPSGRETYTYNSLNTDRSLAGQPLAGNQRPIFNRPFRQELEELEAEFARAGSKIPSPRLKSLRFRDRYDLEDSQLYVELLQEREAAIKLHDSGDLAGSSAADAALNARLSSLKKNHRKEFVLLRDNYHLFRQQTPVMHWDRRAYEPLAVQPSDFFPQVPCALLDFQPKAMAPHLRQHGAQSTFGDMSEVMLRFWYSHGLMPVSSALNSLWPGFGDLTRSIGSLRDTARGGVPLTDYNELTARCINEAQWSEMVQTFADWDFRPTYPQLVGRLMDDVDSMDADDDETAKVAAMGSATN
ncbi:hypothetical protein ACJ41O_011786 [Fusarium nematophilum]